MVDQGRLVILTVLLYLAPKWFFKCGRRWFDELDNPEDSMVDRARTLRQRFWRAVALVVALEAALFAVLWAGGSLPCTARYWLRVGAVTIALVAALGRGGWAIQSYKGETVIERIDRGMWVLGQLGATGVLLFALTL